MGNKLTIGGQALIEGVLMVSPERASAAVRNPQGDIILKEFVSPQKDFFSKLPVVRGSIGLVRQMVIGISALMYSAKIAETVEFETEVQTSNFEEFLGSKLYNKFLDILVYISLIFSLFLAVCIFILLPNFLANLFHFNSHTHTGVILYNFTEGIVRVMLFFSYIAGISKMKSIKRVWEYHGAEHKTVHCYENGEALTINNVKKYSTRHPRCGTSFLFTVMIVSIIVFSFTGWHNLLINSIIRILLVPIVAGLAYELIKTCANRNSKLLNIINAPGLLFQKFTTAEPDSSQLEVAIAAAVASMPSSLLIHQETEVY